MSNKERVIELIRGLPDDVTVDGIMAALSAQSSARRPTEELEWSSEELTEDEWMQFVAHSLRDELNDPREDIYTEQDGEPPHAPR
jgi:hypothetical protein